MSVNVGQRHVPDTPQTAQCYAVDAALDLACHTLKIAKNHNIFTDEYVEIRSAIIAMAVAIHNHAYTANRIRVSKVEDWEARNRMQKNAISEVNSLLGYINIAKRVYHLKRGKTEYWVNKALNTRNLLTSWHQADAKRYADLGT
jgi:hypothetical protein